MIDAPDFLTYHDLRYFQIAPAQRWTGYRALHKSEGGRPTPDGMPCVIPSLNVDHVALDAPMQITSFALANGYNPAVTGDKWRVVHSGGVALCNRQGYDDDRTYTRRDYVNLRNLNAMDDTGKKPAYPFLMKGIVCAGNYFTGQISGNELVMTPGVDAIDGTRPMPSVAEIMERHWFFHATTARQTATGWKVSNFPQGAGAPVLVPYILREQARYPLAFFEPWNSEALPDPLKIYNPV